MEPTSRPALLRALLLVAVLGGLFLVGKLTGVLDDFDAERVRTIVEDAGAWGFLVFILLFALGELVHVPGFVFVIAAVLAYGERVGFALSLVGAVISVSVSFALVRAVGGKALTKLRFNFLQKMLSRLDARPISTVIILRLILWIAPPLNYALAMSNLRFRDYLVGSAVGLVLPVLLMSLFFERLFS